MPDTTAYRFPETFVHLGDDGSARPLPVTESFWPDLVSGRLGLGPGRLVSFLEFDADWSVWEVHPRGEELVCLFSGAMDLLLQGPAPPDGPGDGRAGRRAVPLREPGDFLVVPRGTWHSARVHRPSRALFVTAGEGTEHRPA